MTPFQLYVAGQGPRCKPSFIYVASSWRNMLQVGVVAALRAAKLDVYDFKQPTHHPEGGFRWTEVDPNWQQWTPAQWREGLTHPIALSGYQRDFSAMAHADCAVLVLPCGRSAHMEVGYMAGQGKPVFTLAVEPTEPDLMNLLLGPP